MGAVVLLPVPARVAAELTEIALADCCSITEDLHGMLTRFLQGDRNLAPAVVTAKLDEVVNVVVLIRQLGLPPGKWPDGLTVTADRAVLEDLLGALLERTGDEGDPAELQARTDLAHDLNALLDTLRRVSP